ncbi:unnamed protein product [Pseudo-nitzschia multistriata]|uniref:Uncharacterized protein n=1 Tax=Pseudo-nitzschia multistriata TaxID=183589 RepID=A0A448Z5R4_9STRA|nr:unnamed protein product [Pseudo-nitzschia multistriata]
MELETGSNGNMYQVSYSEANVGKMVKSSKIRVTWDFFSNGGRQHQVVLAWSKSTGKQQITMDGTEVWFGRNKGRSVLDHNWKTRDESLKLHVLATCAPPMNEHFRNYELLINGQLFASLPSCGREDSSFAPLLPSVGTGKLSSIIEILYPNGYTPPLDKDQLRQQKQKQQQQGARLQDLAPSRSNTSSKLVPYNNNETVAHRPIVDLLI